MRISDWSSDVCSSDLTNPDPVGDRPNPTTNEIHRRVFNATNPDTPYQVVGNADPNGTFKDFTAASGVLYEYRARAIAGEFFTDSTDTVADDELALQGVWIERKSAWREGVCQSV